MLKTGRQIYFGVRYKAGRPAQVMAICREHCVAARIETVHRSSPRALWPISVLDQALLETMTTQRIILSPACHATQVAFKTECIQSSWFLDKMLNKFIQKVPTWYMYI